MTFSSEQAFKIAKYYDFLIGKELDFKKTKDLVTHILVTPDYSDGLADFWNNWTREENNKTALLLSAHDKSRLLVFVVSYDGFGNILIYNELDNYLSRHNIEKAYLNPSF